jgi:hypothetical protein
MTEVDQDIVRIRHAVDAAAHNHSDPKADHARTYANVIRELRDDLAVLPPKESARVLSAAITSMVQDGLLYLPSSFDFDTSKVKATVDQDKIQLTDKSGKGTITISEGAISPTLNEVEKQAYRKNGVHSLLDAGKGLKVLRGLQNATHGATVTLPDLTVESHVPMNVIAEDLLHREGIAKPTPHQIDSEVKMLKK